MLNQVAAIKKSDVTAFETVYEQLHRKVYCYFLRRAKDEETAKDLSQQTFIKLWNSRASLSEQHSIDTNCFTIATSVLIDHIRKQTVETKRRAVLAEQDTETDHYAYADKAFESSDYLHSVAHALPTVRRNVFMLKITKGYSNKEIAEKLSISVKTVEDHYSKAIRQIRTSSASLPVTLMFFLFQY